MPQHATETITHQFSNLKARKMELKWRKKKKKVTVTFVSMIPSTTHSILLQDFTDWDVEFVLCTWINYLTILCSEGELMNELWFDKIEHSSWWTNWEVYGFGLDWAWAEEGYPKLGLNCFTFIKLGRGLEVHSKGSSGFLPLVRLLPLLLSVDMSTPDTCSLLSIVLNYFSLHRPPSPSTAVCYYI